MQLVFSIVIFLVAVVKFLTSNELRESVFSHFEGTQSSVVKRHSDRTFHGDRSFQLRHLISSHLGRTGSKEYIGSETQI